MMVAWDITNGTIGVGFAEYRDGTSNTIFIAENLTGVDLFDGGGAAISDDSTMI